MEVGTIAEMAEFRASERVLGVWEAGGAKAAVDDMTARAVVERRTTFIFSIVVEKGCRDKSEVKLWCGMKLN